MYANTADIEAQLRGAGLLLESAKNTHGGTPAGALYVDSMRSVRCDVAGETKRQTGAYRLHTVRVRDALYIAGCYWVDHGNSSFKLELNKECEKCGADFPLKSKACPACGHGKARAKPIDQDALEAHRKAQAEALREAERQAAADADAAAQWADLVWLRGCVEPGGDHQHDYITRKHLSGYHGARIFTGLDGVALPGAERKDYEALNKMRGALALPMVNARGQRRALQFILSREQHADLIRQRETDKQFWPRGIINDGLYTIIGGQILDIGIITEGFATGATLHEETNLPVAVAYQANRLLPVGEALWKRSKKRLRLLYAADDDWLQRCRECKKYTTVDTEDCCHCGNKHGKSNAGVKASREAAQATSGTWAAPAFSTERPRDRKGDTDFNDLRVREGTGAVRVQIAAKLEAVEWSLRPSAAAVADLKGGGEARRAAAIMPVDDIVERFVPLDDGTGDYVWDIWTSKIVKHKQMIALLPAGVRGDDIKRHPVWQERGAYFLSQVGFDPTGKDPTVKLNTWQGWPMAAAAGSCERILELLHYLCTEDRIFKWLQCWMAYPLQNPGAKLGSAVIMHGPQGTGKSVIFNRVLASIYGDYATVLNQRGLEDRFNADWIDSKLYMCAEEVVARAEMWHIKNELKELVTGEWVRINPKNVAAYRQRNQVNVVYLSNEGQPLPIENDDRRHLVVYTPPKLGPDFYDEVFAEIDAGGIAAFYHHLLNLDIQALCPGWHPKKHPPMTEAKQALIDLSAPSETRFVQDWLHGDAGLPICPALATDVYESYMRWCRRNGEARPRPSNHFIGALDRLGGWRKKKVQVYDNTDYQGEARNQSVIFPPDAALQIAGHAQPDGHTQLRWVTDSSCRFRSAVFGEDKRWAA
jgi:putative DNA primase/helicase